MVSFADLRARNVQASWQEAVAVVQELIQATIAEHGSAARLPDIGHFALTVEGRIVLLPGSESVGQQVGYLVTLLDTLLEGGTAPQPLLDLAERNRGQKPECVTAEEFAKALSFFERPGRSDDIAQLVGRALVAEEQTRADHELQQLIARTRENASAKPIEEAVPSRRPHTRAWPLILGVGTAAAFVAAIGSLYVFAARAGTLQRPPAAGQASHQDQPTPLDAKAATPSSQPASLLDRVSRAVRSTVASLAGRSTAPAPAEATAPTAPAAPRRAHRAKSPGASDTTAERRGRDDVRVTITDLGGYPLDSLPTADAEVAAIDTDTIYSPSDEGVLAPVLIRPVIPEPAGPDAPPDTIAVFDLVVGLTGAVERVHVVSFPRRYHDRMIVSHVKAWTFQPATRDGAPVRCRLRVRLPV
jgi:hypothetical protein